MFYFMLIIGTCFFIVGYFKHKKEKKNFKNYYQQINEQEEALLSTDDDLKNEIETLQLEIEKLKTLLKTYKLKAEEKKPVIQEGLEENTKIEDVTIYKNFIQKFQRADDDTIDELAKELKIGKGELLLLKNLLRK